MLLEKKWLIKEVDEQVVVDLAQKMNISSIVARILVSRGMTDKKAVEEFLQGAKEPYHSPYLLKDMQKAVERICLAINKKEKIVIYGDYDVDGITASSLLYLFLSNYKADVDYYIPKRQSEGYGLNTIALKQLADEGVDLIVTVDCGISATSTIAEAPKKMDIIVTDHHNPPDILPDAFAVINPKQLDCLYPYKDLAGVGVAFKLCQALYQKLNDTKDFWQEHLDLVALGTIADIVVLTGENRELVKRGLAVMSKTKSVGLQALLKVARIQNKKINTGSIGFILAPRLNASGRLASAKIGVKLLTTNDESLAQQLAQQLEVENLNRQEIEKVILEQAENLIAEQGGANTVLVLAHEDWHPGVIGIVASRLVEKYHLPTIMISIGEDGGKASCRSISSFDMYKALSAMQDYLIQFGGHHQAAGFSIAKEKIDDFRKALTFYAKDILSKEDYIPKLNVEVIVNDLKEINHTLVKELSKLEPYGMGNPNPVLAVKDVYVVGASAIGVDGQHLKMFVRDKHTDVSAIMWRKGKYKDFLYEGAKISLAFIPEINEWRNEQMINLRIIDIKQKCILSDFRKSMQKNKQEMLFSILQNNKKTAIYLNNYTKELSLPKENVFLFGQLPKEDVEQIVFLQPPYKVIDDSNWWQSLKVLKLRYVFLAYDKNDVDKELERLEIAFPNYYRLKEYYKVVREQEKVFAEKVVQEEKILLKILLEIGALSENNGVINVVEVEEGRKLQLDSSVTYKNSLENVLKIKNSLYKCLNLSQKDLAKMLFS